ASSRLQARSSAPVFPRPAPGPASRPTTGAPFPPLPVQGKDLCPPQDERGSVGGGVKFRDTFAPSAGGPLADLSAGRAGVLHAHPASFETRADARSSG